MDDIRIEQQGHIGVLTLTRSKALNALTPDMIHTLQQQLLQWQNDETVHAVVLQAEPGKAFCAGGDVRWIYEAGMNKNQDQLAFFYDEYRLNHLIHSYSKPYIALMDGITMGGGVGISMHGSHAAASENFVFAMPETGIGLFPDIGAVYLLSRCPGNLGLYLALTGQKLSAFESYQAGLLSFVIQSEKLAQVLPCLLTLDLSTQAADKVSYLLKTLMNESKREMPKDNIIDKFKTYEKCFDVKNLEELFNRLEASSSPHALDTLKVLLEKSPLSLDVTFLQMQKAKNMSLAEILEMDYCLVQNFMHGTDFYEGVRALLVDKDKNPRWQKSYTLSDVQGYFNCEAVWRLADLSHSA